MAEKFSKMITEREKEFVESRENSRTESFGGINFQNIGIDKEEIENMSLKEFLVVVDGINFEKR